jgi:acyl-CoA synthetase (AMP-forming)/AMP-acid ligase II
MPRSAIYSILDGIWYRLVTIEISGSVRSLNGVGQLLDHVVDCCYRETLKSIVEYCRAQLAAYKVPRAVQFVDDFPKTSSGKIMRHRLNELDSLAG